MPDDRSRQENNGGLLRNTRKTECGAKQFLIPLAVRTAPFALLRNSPAQRSLTRRNTREFLVVWRAAPALCAFKELARTTERGGIVAWLKCGCRRTLCGLCSGPHFVDTMRPVLTGHEAMHRERGRSCAGGGVRNRLLTARFAVLTVIVALGSSRNQFAALR
jgi:hypothetical protein